MIDKEEFTVIYQNLLLQIYYNSSIDRYAHLSYAHQPILVVLPFPKYINYNNSN